MARAAHEAARCAAEAGRFWPYHDRLFEAQPRFERDELLRYATDVGLDLGPFTRCLDARTFAAAVEADISQGRALGVRGTPTFFVNGQMLVGAQPVDVFRPGHRRRLGAEPLVPFRRVASIADIPEGQCLFVEANGAAVAVFNAGGGRVYACGAVCPHEDGPLARAGWRGTPSSVPGTASTSNWPPAAAASIPHLTIPVYPLG